MIKNCFPDAKLLKKFQKLFCKECTNVQKDINGKDERIDPPEDIEQNVFSSYFIEKHVFTVKSIEVSLNEINLERVQKKGEKLSSHEHDKNITVQHKKRKGTLPKIASPANKNTSEAEFSEDTSTIEEEKGVNDRKYGKSKKMMRKKT